MEPERWQRVRIGDSAPASPYHPGAEGFKALPWPNGEIFYGCVGQVVDAPAHIAAGWLRDGLAEPVVDAPETQ